VAVAGIAEGCVAGAEDVGEPGTYFCAADAGVLLEPNGEGGVGGW